MSEKIQATHRERRAVVYVRQSSPRQVIEHPESGRRQRDLYQRALELGWPETAIEVIERDLGKSANLAGSVRTGFQHLNEEVIQGRVGAIFALEVARLARSSSEWHRLLDLCGVADVVIIDEQAAYHPADPSDRMFLGIKGAMSEAELGWMRQRMRGALISKARRGELHLPVTAGYQWDDASARLILDPDEEVQRVIRLVFERFQIERNGCRVARYFQEHHLRLPARQSGGDRAVYWSAPSSVRIFAILHNPIYAGAYVYGRHARHLEISEGQVVRRIRELPMDKWLVLLRDHHPGYISWDEFVENQRILTENRNSRAAQRHGATHKGEALLQGLTLCGHCGRRMQVRYFSPGHGKPSKRQYVCKTPKCRWSMIAPPIDKMVESLFLEALRPDAVALGVAVMAEVEHQQAELERQWSLRIERVRYEANLAERRYKAVDPDHRTVARNLEREWDAKLRELDHLEAEYREAVGRDKIALTSDDRARLANLSADVPRLWNSPSTTMAQRKTMLRTLVREVALTKVGDHGTQVRLLWQTGAVSEFSVQLPPNPHAKGRHYDPATIELLRALAAAGKTAGQMSEALNDANLRTPTGLSWTQRNVYHVCERSGVKLHRLRPPPVLRRSDGAYSLRGVARRLHVTPWRARYWVTHGWLTPIKAAVHGERHWFRLDQATIARLRRVRDTHCRPKRTPAARKRPRRARRRQPHRQGSSNPVHREVSHVDAIADGMGGSVAGEIAAQMAVDLVRDSLRDPGTMWPERDSGPALLAAAIERANRAIYNAAQGTPVWRGMGTTIAAVLVHGHRIALAHVGDSRIYRLRDGRLSQLTEDHSLFNFLVGMGRADPEHPEEFAHHNVILRALGAEPLVEVDARLVDAAPGDAFLLCSDGVSGMVPPRELASILVAHTRPSEAVERIVARANELGGPDNITAVVLRWEATDTPTRMNIARADMNGDSHAG
jgi:serine/threonine protein phosphatase PrpC/DNA invertase Pin-like site-specific DNA recombinase